MALVAAYIATVDLPDLRTLLTGNVVARSSGLCSLVVAIG